MSLSLFVSLANRRNASARNRLKQPKVLRLLSKSSLMFIGGCLKLTGGKPDPLPPPRHERLRMGTTSSIMFLSGNGNVRFKFI